MNDIVLLELGKVQREREREREEAWALNTKK